MSPTLNGEVLKEIANKNRTATIISAVLSQRERHRTESDITRTWFELIRAGEKVDQKEYFQFWKDLQSAGVGSIVHGRKGNHDKFAWNYSLKRVGQGLVQGGPIESERLGEEPHRKPKIEKVESKSVDEAPKKRGRPPGSKNKTTLMKAKRGRPHKYLTTGGMTRVQIRPGLTLEISNEKLTELLQGISKD